MGSKTRGRKVDGWLILDKPLGMSSSQAVGAVRRLLDAAKAGHGGTLDPQASGVLPVALGEATKTVAWAMAGRKTYRFTVRWGEARDTDDAAGRVIATSPARPAPPAIAAALADFIGTVEQRPPAYSALKIAGERAYDLARSGAAVELAPRLVEVRSLRLLEVPGPDEAEFEAVVGKGTYIRAIARDLGVALGTLAHVSALRRLQVGPFRAEAAISLENLAALGHSAAASGHVFPVETALDDIPALALTEDEAGRLRCGQAVTPWRPSDRARIDQLGEGATIRATTGGKLVAVAEIVAGGIRPVRVLNL
jgi:tRNA pseudouridine55 synthase